MYVCSFSCKEYNCTGPAFACSLCGWDAHPHCAWRDRAADAAKEATLTEAEFKEKVQLLKDKVASEAETERQKALLERGKVFTVTRHSCVLKLYVPPARAGFSSVTRAHPHLSPILPSVRYRLLLV
jgi:hypothetical protein